MRNTISFILVIVAIVLFNSCTIEDPKYKVVSMVTLCVNGPFDVTNENYYIDFDDDTFTPQPNTWYKSEFGGLWYKTGSDVTPTKAAVHYSVLSIHYSDYCQ